MTIIRVENLTKEYVLGGAKKPNTFRDLIGNVFSRKNKASTKRLRALDEVSFTIDQGETVGIIGNNGAGKSTLLKILSRIVLPTSGEALLYGRTGSLLEVGTGFHRELSGRENIFLNGAILGMKRTEIESKFEEIVEFAEVSDFLDTPIKHYSSGMFTRLAFSVAAHLEPEILIVDEVLAVGDLAFQRKCMDKMREVNQKGRTILFVSHNMQAVTRVCDRAIWIDNGRIVGDDLAETIVSGYLEKMLESSTSRTWDSQESPGDDVVRLRNISVGGAGSQSSVFSVLDEIEISFEIELLKDTDELTPGIELTNDQGISVFSSDLLSEKPNKKGRYRFDIEIPKDLLAESNYFLTVRTKTIRPFVMHFEERDTAAFLVTDQQDGRSTRGHFGGSMPGVVRPRLPWRTSAIND